MPKSLAEQIGFGGKSKGVSEQDKKKRQAARKSAKTERQGAFGRLFGAKTKREKAMGR